MKIKITALTDVGKERTNNEDDLIYCSDLLQQDWREDNLPEYVELGELGTLLVVADGMGGANAGEVASLLAIETVKERFSVQRVQEALAAEDEGITLLLKDTIAVADEAINQRMATDIETQGMGTTIVICWILKDGKAYIAWCGDSRCYVFNAATGLRRLTKDHSYVQELIDKGEITEEEAFNHPDNNIITCGLGDFQAYPAPGIVTYELKANDNVMLCSDGLCGYCTDDDIKRVFSSEYVETDVCCQKMLDHALDAGGADNIAIVMASLIDDDQEKPEVIKRSWFVALLQKLFGSNNN
ncbi:MAG: protein phosphatase 2C domain-containing protein [Prevotella sp.]|nr:protein phosphatase 2C domain-containing protein [Prevotella sp.]